MKTCLTTTKIGTTIKLNNTIISGTPPYDVIFKKDGVELKSFHGTTTTEQETTYTTIPSDKGTRRFSVDITDSCSVPKSASEYCDVEITETTEDCMQLILKRPRGSISFNSTPSGADIYIDNVLQSDKTNMTIPNVTTGSHSYTLKLAGYNDATGTVTVTTGQTVTVSVTLTSSSVWNILSKGFIISGNHFCGEVVNENITESIQIWTSIKVNNAPVNLKVTVKLNFTDENGAIQEIIIQKTELIQVGTYEIIVSSDKNYSIGTYDIIEVKGELL